MVSAATKFSAGIVTTSALESGDQVDAVLAKCPFQTRKCWIDSTPWRLPCAHRAPRPLSGSSMANPCTARFWSMCGAPMPTWLSRKRTITQLPSEHSSRTPIGHLTRGCPVPLLLTKRHTWGQPPVIMAAVDPHQASENTAALDDDILSSAVSLAGRLGADLHVIHTFIPAALAAVVAAGGRVMTRECSEAVNIENSFRNCQLERLVSTYGVTQAHLHVEMGTPEDCLMDAVTRYHTDVMVMGASSHGRWHRMVVGSTAATILESLSCDFLIVRPTDDA
jgi:nucleotide-binding universal stress UspA family protein